MSTAVPKLIFDIETIGVDFDVLDTVTQESLTRWIKKEAAGETDYETMLDELKSGLGFSPLTGEIVTIGILDYHTGQGEVCFAAPGEKLEMRDEKLETAEIKFQPMDEKAMLQKFWDIARKYPYFITFNGRGFDAPFLMIRSAVHGIRPSKDLMRARYLYQQSADAVHIDLYDQLTFYGTSRSKGNLHMFCRAFGIKTPKESGVTGDNVTALFKDKKFLDIAKYNAGDLLATAELYKYWNEYIRF